MKKTTGGRRKLPPQKLPDVSLQPTTGYSLQSDLEKAQTEIRLAGELLRKHPLTKIFEEAVAQATTGKGDVRHGMGRDSRLAEHFLAQDWLAIAERHGTGFLSGQAEKKLRESLGLPAAERRAELLGTLVYVAMLIIACDRGARS